MLGKNLAAVIPQRMSEPETAQSLSGHYIRSTRRPAARSKTVKHGTPKVIVAPFHPDPRALVFVELRSLRSGGEAPLY